jgi:hypothetical protein
MWQIIGMVLALLLGLYIGMGFPGLPGREDRVVSRRGQRVHHFTPIDLLRPRKRQR